LKLSFITIRSGTRYGFRAKSTKTRIETECFSKEYHDTDQVLEQNPPKQGLKLQATLHEKCRKTSFRAKSTKTRIETKRGCSMDNNLKFVLEQNPPKQGLKHNRTFLFSILSLVLEQNPPKQGLKLGVYQYEVPPSVLSFRAKSTKTRIETPKKEEEAEKPKEVLEQNPPKQGLKLKL